MSNVPEVNVQSHFAQNKSSFFAPVDALTLLICMLQLYSEQQSNHHSFSHQLMCGAAQTEILCENVGSVICLAVFVVLARTELSCLPSIHLPSIFHLSRRNRCSCTDEIVLFSVNQHHNFDVHHNKSSRSGEPHQSMSEEADTQSFFAPSRCVMQQPCYPSAQESMPQLECSRRRVCLRNSLRWMRRTHNLSPRLSIFDTERTMFVCTTDCVGCSRHTNFLRSSLC